MAGDEADARFAEYAESRDVDLRNALVLDNQGLAIAFARRYRGRGVPDDDLEQIALEALIAALDRFEPDLGYRFSTFAGRSIEGALKQHFRDKTWATQVPRRVRELAAAAERSADALTQELGRRPTAGEIAEAIGASAADVTAALDARAAGYRTSGVVDDERSAPSGTEVAYDRVEARAAVAQLLEMLSDDDRRVVELRFFGEVSQAQIAERVGVSQMQVSRILQRALTRLRVVEQERD